LSRWRLIVDERAHGAWNMGVDEALLASAVSSGRCSLRFYRWQGPWLSLGYAQTLERERVEACARAGVGVVRRVTGGRAVLHGNDLTYAVAAREDQLPAGLIASYGWVAAILIDALARLGVEAIASGAPGGLEAAPVRRGREAGFSVGDSTQDRFDCFARPAQREICVGGRKLAGSAQRRARGGILQHGSIRLAPDPVAARRACSLSGSAAVSLAELEATSEPAAVRAACVAAFEAALGGLERAELSDAERAAADERVREHRRNSQSAPSGYKAREPQESPSPTDR